MDQGWDHTENEDKLLLAQASRMGRDMGTVTDDNIYGSDEVSSVSGSGCNDNYDVNVMDTRLDYNGYLSNIVINNINVLCLTIINSLNFDFDEICSLINWLYCWICKISNICNSESKCKCDCNCKCDSTCTENTICLCLCNCSKAKGNNGCCICICKHKDDCKCVCICICKKGDQCCCGTAPHDCKDCFVKVDITSLKDQTKKITQYLSWIRCQTTINCYKSIISRMHWIELLFNQIRTKINQLITLKNILSPLLIIRSKCPKCEGDCCNKIQDLIDIISISSSYYYKFGSRIKYIRTFVYYKINYNKSNEIISSLQKSIKCLSMINIEINNQIVDSTRNNNSVVQANKLLMSVYSHYSILECYISLSNLSIYSSKLSIALYINQIVENCKCVGNFTPNGNNDFKTTDFWDYVSGPYKNNRDKLKNFFIVKDGNHTCLCFVMKYSLYPSLIKSMYCLRHLYFEGLSKITREFLTNVFKGVHLIEVTKILFIIIDVIYGLSMFKERRYLWATSKVEMIPDLICFCRAPKDKYYLFLTSIILFVSSLIENIWSMDTHNVKIATEKISSLYSQLESYDLSSVKDTKKLSCNSVYTLLIDKQCKVKDKCQCKDGQNCCWCVTCLDLIIMCVSLCLQCKLCNAICNKTKKPNGCKMEKWKDFCKVEKCECKCPKPEGGLCCLLKLALSGAVGCEELKKKLQDCCTECSNQNASCKKILEKVKAGLCKLLLLGCCNDANCGCNTDNGEVKTCCLLFGNECPSVAVVVFCKCGETASGCCCLYNLVEKLKPKIKNICDEKCVYEELQKCEELCCGNKCGQGCVCKTLPDLCKKICNGDGECLCKKLEEIKECIKKCVKGTCDCKNKEGCCRCGWCKIVAQGVRILTRACRANVLEPYKRIVMELLNSTKNHKEVIRNILEGINRTTLNNIYLVKNSYSTYPYSVGSYEGTINGVTNVEKRNWGYDTKYEHDVTNDKGFTYNYPDISNNTASYASSRSSNKAFKMILSRLLVGGVIVFVFLYLRVSYSINNPFCIL